jgi:cytochrome c-type biogenesis protein CcmH/NrfF
VLLAILLVPANAQAQAKHVQGQFKPVAPRTELEKDLYRSIICMCGTCGRQLVGDCTCAYAEQMRQEISALVRQGKTRDQIIQYYIDKYGSEEPLAVPIDKGFNRLAWLLPYAIGVVSVTLVGAVAVRWSRRPARRSDRRVPELAEDVAEIDPEMQERLDDELRNLD